MEQPEIATARLLLRGFGLADADEVARLAGNRRVSATTRNIPYPYPPRQAERWIELHARNWEFRASATWAITLPEPGTLLGAITLTWVHRRLAELGYWIGEAYWGRGYCSEAAGAVIGFAFDELGLHRIVAEHLRANPASGRVMTKAGMRHAGSKRRRFRGGDLDDLELYEAVSPRAAVRPPSG